MPGVNDSPPPKTTAVMSREAIHLIEGRAHKVSSPVVLPGPTFGASASAAATTMPARVPSTSMTIQTTTPTTPGGHSASINTIFSPTNRVGIDGNGNNSSLSRAAQVKALIKAKKGQEKAALQSAAAATAATAPAGASPSPSSPGKGRRAVYQVEHRGRVMCLMFSETHLIMSYGSQAPNTSEAIAAATHISCQDIIGADRGGNNLFRLRIWRAVPTGVEETAIELSAINPQNPERFLTDLASEGPRIDEKDVNYH